MSFFDKLVSNSVEFGSRIGDSIGNVLSSTGTDVKQSAQLTSLEMELKTIEGELDKSYLMIGKKYVDYLLQSGETPVIDVIDILKWMNPKMVRREEIKEEMHEIEKRSLQQDVMNEKLKFEKEFMEKKAALDRALLMDIIDKNEYDKKINEFKVKLDKFDEYKKIETQYELGIINRMEYDLKISQLSK